ncbi:TetR/AcrR family transcriptional regulator [Saccharopolyspora taberi]
MSVPDPPWQQRAARKRSAKRPLDTDVIVRTALELTDREGLDAVSMRRVAQELGTGAASLYAYVRNKSELQELMLDLVIGEVPLPEPDPARWEEQLKQFARDQLRVFTAHPGMAQVVARTPAPTGPNALQVTETMLTLLRGAGLPDRIAAFAVDLLALYPNAIALERTADFALTDGERDERMSQVEDYFAALPAERFPNLLAILPVMMSDEGEERFEFGLELIMRGLRSWVE